MFDLNIELNKVKKIIYNKTGILIKQSKIKYLTQELTLLTKKFKYKNITEYINELNRIDPLDEKFNILIKSLKIDESYFFRSFEQIKFLKTVFIPKLVNYKINKKDYNINFWSAGCSKGQEAYTLSILIHDYINKNDNLDNWNINIYGSDIDVDSLNFAKRALYTKWSLRGVDDYYIKNFFIIDKKNNFRLDPLIMNSTKFYPYNLIDDVLPYFLESTFMDLILCRNVFIYFDKKIISKVSDKFSELLSKKGVLIIGDTEKININKNSKIKFIQSSKFNFYTLKKCMSFNDLNDNENINTSIKNLSFIFNSDKKSIEGTKLNFLNPVKSEIHELANSNKLELALNLCNKEINKNNVDDELHLLHALICYDMGDQESSEKSLRKALFLEPTNVLARFYLGVFLVQKGMKNKGISNLKIALSNAEKKDSKINISILKDISYKEFISTIKSEIENYE